jgi:hypothetical protein
VQEETTKVRAEQIEGLKELISQVIATEGERLIPRRFLMDVEEIRRSPVGAVIRMEGDVKYLKEGQEALQEGQEALRVEMGKLATREEMEALQEGQEALRVEMGKLATREELEALRVEMGKLVTHEELEALRTELKKDLGNLERVMNTRFEGIEERFKGLEGRFETRFEGIEERFKGLERRFEARFEGIEGHLEQFEKRLSRTDFWIKFFAGLVSALFIAQLILTYIK